MAETRRISRPHLGMWEVLSEAASGVTSRPGRSALTALGTVLGVAALVATVGLASTAGSQILNRLDDLAATDVEVAPRPGNVNVLPWNAVSEVERLNGVDSAALISELRTESGSPLPVSTTGLGGAQQVGVIAASTSVWSTVEAELSTGRLLEASDETFTLATAVLGEAAARRLGISDVSNGPAVFIDDQPVTVVGILATTHRRPELLNSVIITNSQAQARFGLTAPQRLQIETSLGANELIRDQVPTLLSPNQPDRLIASSPPLPKEVRANVSSDVAALLLVLGGVSLVVGALGIANVTLVSVLERRGEIGIRRALGALRRHIGIQFLCESTALGFIGGALGTALGIAIVVGASITKGWFPVIPPITVLAAPAIGSLVGLIAGIYPAWRASGIEPAEALRSGAV